MMRIMFIHLMHLFHLLHWPCSDNPLKDYGITCIFSPQTFHHEHVVWSAPHVQYLAEDYLKHNHFSLSFFNGFIYKLF